MKHQFTLSVLTFLFFGSFHLYGQKISRVSGPVSDAVCPGLATNYEILNPPAGCTVTWSATNGTVTKDYYNQFKASVIWDDIPEGKGTLKATLSNCGENNPNNNMTIGPITETILSVKGKSFGSYNNSVPIDYCSSKEVTIVVPKMYVPGTGGIAQPALREVAYSWTIPNGWSTNGSLITSTNLITLYPKKCAVPGIVSVVGKLSDCIGQGAPSAPANISLNGVNPVVTVAPPPSYTGASACDTSPVTFTATTNVALGCISSYEWVYPPSWSFVSQTANTITLRPRGNATDSDPEHPFKATINFNCGSSIVSGPYVPPYAQPLISGSTICDFGRPVSVTHVPTNAQVTWSVSSNMIITSGQGTSTAEVRAVNSNVSEVGLISATVACAGVVVPDKSVWVGRPLFYPYQLTGPERLPLRNQGTYRIKIPQGNVSSYTWDTHGLKQIGSGVSLGTAYMIIEANVTGLRTIDIRAHNSCGSTMTYTYVDVPRSGGGGGGGGGGNCDDEDVRIAPNPISKDKILMVIPLPCEDPNPCPTCRKSNTDNNTNAAEFEYGIYDVTGMTVLSGKSVGREIDIKTLRPGNYILQIKQNGKVMSKQVIIE